jgi:hypothetical protein
VFTHTFMDRVAGVIREFVHKRCLALELYLSVHVDIYRIS